MRSLNKMKKNSNLFAALVASLFLLWVFMITAGAVHSFLPVVPALGYVQVLILNIFIGLCKFLLFTQKVKDVTE